MTKKTTNKRPTYTIQIGFAHGYQYAGEFKSKAAALRAIPQYKEVYRFSSFRVVPSVF